jgi:hypothetical protein
MGVQERQVTNFWQVAASGWQTALSNATSWEKQCSAVCSERKRGKWHESRLICEMCGWKPSLRPHSSIFHTVVQHRPYTVCDNTTLVILVLYVGVFVHFCEI